MQDHSRQNPSRTANALLGGCLGALGGALAAFLFTHSECQGAGADSFCGVILFVILPAWAIGAGAVCALAASIVHRQRILPHAWAGVILGMAAGVIAMWQIGSMARENPSTIKRHESVTLFLGPLLISGGGIVGGVVAKGLRTTMRRE